MTFDRCLDSALVISEAFCLPSDYRKDVPPSLSKLRYSNYQEIMKLLTAAKPSAQVNKSTSKFCCRLPHLRGRGSSNCNNDHAIQVFGFKEGYLGS